MQTALDLSLHGKSAIITGSSSGLGAGIAIMLSKMGAQVCIADRRKDKLEAVAKLCEEASPYKHVPVMVLGDIIQRDVRKSLIDKTVEQFGKIDILINNAGIAAFTDFLHSSLEELDHVMNINVRVPFDLTLMAVPYLEKTKGCVVNISSVVSMKSGYLPGVNMAAYSMSKVALDTMTKAASASVAPKGIRINSLNPGLVPETDIFETHGMNQEQLSQCADILKSKGAPPGTVSDIAGITAFLVSDAAKFINGTTLVADGGGINVL